MGHLDKAIPIQEVEQSKLWLIYGKSGTGKTATLGTFPKPLLYIQIGDDGANTIKKFDGVDYIHPQNLQELKEIAQELKNDTKYATVAVDIFSMIVNEWIYANAISKNKRVTQQMWGDIMTDTQELVKLFQLLAKDKIVVLTCHEVADSFEGMEDEISPDIRPNVSKGARTYLEGMANYGIHTTIINKEVEQPDGTTKTIPKYGVHLGQNPYYWTKTQKDPSIRLPRIVFNPTYDKIIKLLEGGQ